VPPSWPIDSTIRGEFRNFCIVLSRYRSAALPAKSKLIAYRVYLSAASMKVGKELEFKFQIMTGTIHALMN
jgi:hypothetical protein